MSSYSGKQVVLFPSQKNIERHPISISEHGVEGESYLIFEWYEGEDRVEMVFEVNERRAFIGDISLKEKNDFLRDLNQLFSIYIKNRVKSIGEGAESNEVGIEKKLQKPAKSGKIHQTKIEKVTKPTPSGTLASEMFPNRIA
jgi:hypothetical protein